MRADRLRFIGALPVTFALVAESALVLVFAALLDPGQSQRPAPGSELLLLIGLAVVGRFVAVHSRSRWLLVVTLVAGGVVGWLLSPGVIAALGDARPVDALLTNPAGWLGAVVVWRGMAYRSERSTDDASSDLLERGLVVLVLPWLAIVVATGEMRSGFATTAFPATLLFMTMALPAVGLVRLRRLAEQSGMDWRRNRAWLVITGAVVVLMALIGLPAALMLGQPVNSVFEALLWPVLAALTLTMLIAATFVGLPLGLLMRSVGLDRALEAPAVATPGQQQAVAGQDGTVLAAVLVAIAVGVLILLAYIVRRLGANPDPDGEGQPARPQEERVFVLPRLRLPRRRPALQARGRSPRPASDAYLAALAAFSAHGTLGRRASETPAQHARRVGPLVDSLALSLLSADYALEEYGQRTLTTRETRRAQERSRRLQVLVRPAR